MDVTQRSFTAGEVSPSASARADLDWYTSALAKCENAYIKIQGGIYNRPGTRFIGEIPGWLTQTPAFNKIRLVNFSYGQDEPYILIFAPIKIFMVDGDSLSRHNAGHLNNITTPYANPLSLDHTSYSDTMYIVGNDNKPYLLVKKGNNIEDWDFTPIDFGKDIGSPTIVSIEPKDSNRTPKKYFQYQASFITKEDVEGKQFPFAATLQPPTADNYLKIKIAVTAALNVNLKQINIYKSVNGSPNILGFIGSHTVTETGAFDFEFKDENFLPDVGSPPKVPNTPFGDYNKDIEEGHDGYPGVIGIYQQRLIFGSTRKFPQRVYCSETNDFKSLRGSKPLLQTDAIIQDISSGRTNKFIHILDNGGLTLLTTGSEVRVSSGLGFKLTPEEFSFTEASNFGASDARPTKSGSTSIFTQAQGAKLIGLEYEDSLTQRTQNPAKDLTIRATHLFEGRQVVDMTNAKEPDSVIYCVMSDGELVGLTHNKEQQVVAFHGHKTKGKFYSAASRDDSNKTNTYFAVERTVQGVKKMFIERQSERIDHDITRAEFLDSSIVKEYTNPSPTVDGLDHLNGQVVSVVADGAVYENITVRRGSLNLPFSPAPNPAQITARRFIVGLPYETIIKTLPVESIRETTEGKTKTITSVTISIYRTVDISVSIDGKNFATHKAQPLYDDDISAGLHTDKINVRTRPGIGKDVSITIKHKSPLPLTILSITPHFEVNG